MHADTISPAVSGQGARKTPREAERAASAQGPGVGPSASVAPMLLTDREAAQAMGIGVTTFHSIRNQDWMPKPIKLSAKIVRWSRSELEHALASMPRQTQASEPAQLRRGRIEAMKRGSAS